MSLESFNGRTPYWTVESSVSVYEYEYEDRDRYGEIYIYMPSGPYVPKHI